MKVAVLGTENFGCAVVSLLGNRVSYSILDPNYIDDHTMPFVIDEIAKCTLGILAWWPHKIKEPLLSAPRLGWLNMHPSLLPFGRGKDPYFWAIVNNEPFGATIHWVTDKIDAGPIAFQKRIDIAFTDTAYGLKGRAQYELKEMITHSLIPALDDGYIPSYEQPEAFTKTHTRQNMLDYCADYNKDMSHFVRLLRARTGHGYPVTVNGKTYLVDVSIREPI